MPEESRLVDQLSNSESKTPSSSDNINSNPQSKLVKDIMSRQVEQEAIARGGTSKGNEVRVLLHGYTIMIASINILSRSLVHIVSRRVQECH